MERQRLDVTVRSLKGYRILGQVVNRVVLGLAEGKPFLGSGPYTSTQFSSFSGSTFPPGQNYQMQQMVLMSS